MTAGHHHRGATLVLLAGLVSGCGGSDDEASSDPGPCADASQVLAFPTPAWQTGALLTPPAGDFAVAMLAEVKSKWAAELSLVDGWPARPTLLIPLEGSATSAESAKLALFGSVAGGVMDDLGIEIGTTLSDDGTTLIAVPRDPVPAGVDEVVFVVRRGALSGARALPACGTNGRPLAAYADAAASLPSGTEAELALPMRIATTPRELPALHARISKSPVLEVAKIEERTGASFGAAAPPPDVAAVLGKLASGILELPAYADASGVFERADDGGPKVQGVTRPGFIVALPVGGSAPYPFVLFQHGGGQNKSDFLQLAKPLAQAGFAFVAIDLPYHGDRAMGAGGTDLDFVDFSDLAKTRDNFRQAAADHMAVFTGIAALNQAIETTLGVSTALDQSQGYYMGLSLGGISGSLTFASTPNVKGAGLFVAAGGYPELVSKGLFAALVANIVNRPTPERESLLGLAEVILDGADPLAYAQRVEDRTIRPRPAIFFQAIGDPVVPENASDQWARSFGAGLAKPFQHPVDGMAALALPAKNNFAFESGGASATRVLLQNPMNEIPAVGRHGALIVQPYSQATVAACFSAIRSTESCEVIDSGFATH